MLEENTVLTVETLRERLKHIAVLCYGLSIDLNNCRKALRMLNDLRAENENLNRIIKELKAEYEAERKSIYNRKYGATRRKKQ